MSAQRRGFGRALHKWRRKRGLPTRYWVSPWWAKRGAVKLRKVMGEVYITEAVFDQIENSLTVNWGIR